MLPTEKNEKSLLKFAFENTENKIFFSFGRIPAALQIVKKKKTFYKM